MSNIKSNLPKELKEKVKQIVESGDDTKVWELLTKSVRCTIRDDGITEYDGCTCNTLWDYLQVVAEIRNIDRPPLPEEKNTNFHTLVRLWGKDIHPLYADWLFVCTAEDLVKLVGVIKDEHPTTESLKDAYAKTLKFVGRYAPRTAEILNDCDSHSDKKKQDFKRNQYDAVMLLYIVKYLLLGKPFNLATEYSESNFDYNLHEWFEPTETMKRWEDFVKERSGRRHGRMPTQPKDERPASYAIDEHGVRILREKVSHAVMRVMRHSRKGLKGMSKDEKILLYPFDGMDYNCKRWSGIIQSRILLKGGDDAKIDPKGDELVHTMMWEVFGKDTTKMEGKDFSVLLFNNQRRRDLAYEWVKGEPVVYDK